MFADLASNMWWNEIHSCRRYVFQSKYTFTYCTEFETAERVTEFNLALKIMNQVVFRNRINTISILHIFFMSLFRFTCCVHSFGFYNFGDSQILSNINLCLQIRKLITLLCSPPRCNAWFPADVGLRVCTNQVSSTCFHLEPGFDTGSYDLEVIMVSHHVSTSYALMTERNCLEI